MERIDKKRSEEVPREKHKRWKEAQKAELEWWEHWRELYFYKNHSFKSYWSTRMEALGIDHTDFTNKRIVEVGCGPHGVVSYLFPNSIKVGIDPLAAKYRERAKPVGNALLITGVGEHLPIRDGAADLALCINVIDHVISAEGVLQEIRRVLKKSGDLVLEVHTFPSLLTPLMVLDAPHTYHWSVDKLVDLVQGCKFKIHKIEKLNFNVNLSRKSYFLPRDWKYIFGNMFMKLTYIHAHKGP